MAESLGELYLSLSLKTADLEAQLNQIKEKTQSTTDNMGSSFKSMLLPMAGIAGGMFGITKAFEFGSDSVKKYIEQAQGFAKVEAIIKSTGGAAGFTATELSGIADELSKINGIDDSEIMNGITANMLTFSNVSGQVFKDAQQSVLDMTAVMGGDLTGASIRLGKALNDPITGVTALQRVGVRLTDAQKEQVKAFMESGDIISAQNMILGELKKEFGGASEAANKASGGLKELSVNTEKLMEAIGGVIMFGLKPFIEVSNFVIGNISKLGQQANTTEDSMVKLRLDFESTAMGLLNLSGNTHKTAVEQEAYTKLIDDANTKYGQFLPKLITEKDSYNSIKTAISGARIELDKYIQSKITEAMVDSKLATLAPLKEKLINATTAEASLVHETKWTGGEQGLDKQNKEWNINRTKTVSDRINAENEYNKALSEVNKLIEEGNKIDAKNIVKLGEKLPLPVTEKEKKEYKNVIKLRTTYEEVFSSGGSIETEASKTAFATWEKAKNKYVQSVKNINTGGSDNKESEANQKKWDEQESNLKKWNLDNEKFDDAHLAKILENIETERKANIDNEHDLTETNKWAENEKKKAYKDNADYHKELEDKSFDDFKKEKDDELELMLSLMDAEGVSTSDQLEYKKAYYDELLAKAKETYAKDLVELKKHIDEINKLSTLNNIAITVAVKKEADEKDKESKKKKLTPLEQFAKDNETLGKAIESASQSMESVWANAMDGMLKGTENFGEGVKSVFVGMADIVVAEIERMIAKMIVMFIWETILGIFSGGASKLIDNTAPIVTGGSQTFGNMVPAYANGGEFIVPQGYSNDNYLARFTSGETVSVKPVGSNGTGLTDSKLDTLINSVQAMNKNLIQKDMSVKINSTFDSTKFYKDDTIKSKIRFTEAGRKE